VSLQGKVNFHYGVFSFQLILKKKVKERQICWLSGFIDDKKGLTAEITWNRYAAKKTGRDFQQTFYTISLILV